MIGTAPRDWDEACHAVSDAYFPHTLTPLSRHAASGVGVCTTELGPLRIAHIRWGADVAVESDHPGAYGVNIPLSGELESVFAGSHVLSTQGVATVCPPDITTRITRWSADCEIVGVRMDRQYLDREMEKVLGRPGMPLPDQVDLRGDDGARWLKFVRSLSDQILGPVGVLHNELVAGQLSGAVVTAFVLAAMPESEDAVRHARPRIVKRVLDEMHDDPAACGPQPRWRRWRASAYGDCRRDFGSTWAGVRRNACSTSVSSGSMQIWWMPTTRRRSPMSL